MTPTAISNLSDHELAWEIDLKLGWKHLWRVETPEGDRIRGLIPGSHERGLVPDWPRDPAASAELMRTLTRRGAWISTTLTPVTVLCAIWGINGVQQGDVQISSQTTGTDPILALCRAVAEAALAALTEGKT